MNVLKKDSFVKPGARMRNVRSDFSNATTSRFVNVLPFLPQGGTREEFSSQSSVDSSGSFVTSRPSHQSQEFHQFIQPFVEEIERPVPDRSAEHSSLASKREGDINNSHDVSESKDNDGSTTDDVLRALSEGSSTSEQNRRKRLFSQNLNLRPPINQSENEEIQQPLESGRTPISSVRAQTTSSGKRTPRTPKTTSSTGVSDSDVSCCIIAVTEGRGLASGEVGIAAMDPRRPHLILCQISDSQRYTRTLAKMNVFNFTEAIVPNTFVEGPTPRKLYMDMMDNFPSAAITNVRRKHFSEGIGQQMINQYCSRESESVMIILKDKFYALAAAAALLKYIEFRQSVLFAPCSLHVEFQGTEGTTIIDLDTANRLELVMGLASRDEQQSLLGVMKHCRTKGGVRLLRANLLQPSCDEARINSRLDCVTELIENPFLCNAVEDVISQMKNAESLLSLCMHPPQQTGLKAAQFQLKYSLLLKTILELVPALSLALSEANSEYFKTVRENLGDVRLASILRRVHKTIIEGNAGSRGATQLHGCFMICSGINGLLDIAKKTYVELAQEITAAVEALRKKLQLPMKLGYSQSKGYHIIISPLDQLPSELPAELILKQRYRNSIICYTTELVALDQRCQQALHEIELMTNALLFDMLNDIRGEISCLYPLCECLAELDVCISLATVGMCAGYVRPNFGDELNIGEARHPILDVRAKEKVVANDVFADSRNNFLILTGPNQSGKSIYIRQIALLQVMAQVGSFVPASHATFRLADRVFSRIGFDDSIEGNSSTLMVELHDMEFIRNNLTKNSLVIIDELCRGTSVDEGTCLAFTLCEELIDTNAFVFFTTHFMFLTKLQEIYCNVRNFHFETTPDDSRPILHYTHKMLSGTTTAEQYGIRLAELMGYLPSILETAKKCSQILQRRRKPQPGVCGLTARYEISQKLMMNLPQSEDATWEQIAPVIHHYKELYEALPPESDAIIALLNQEESQPMQDERIPSPEPIKDNLEQISPQGPQELTRVTDNVESVPEDENSERTREAAMLLLSLHSAQTKSGPKKKKQKREEKGVTEFVMEMGEKLPPVSDKNLYYQWKYSRDKKALEAVATASRNSPTVKFDEESTQEDVSQVRVVCSSQP